MTRHKAISFRPTDTAFKALAILTAKHGNRSRAINAALVAAVADPGPTEQALTVMAKDLKIDPSWNVAGGIEVDASEEPKLKRRRTKTNATIAPPPNATGGTLRRSIPKPAWKA